MHNLNKEIQKKKKIGDLYGYEPKNRKEKKIIKWRIDASK